MAGLSLVLEAFQKQQGLKRQSGRRGFRLSATAPSAPGFARGALGSFGSRTFQSRDSSASGRKEQELLQSPIFQAYIQQSLPSTPVSDFLARR